MGPGPWRVRFVTHEEVPDPRLSEGFNRVNPDEWLNLCRELGYIPWAVEDWPSNGGIVVIPRCVYCGKTCGFIRLVSNNPEVIKPWGQWNGSYDVPTLHPSVGTRPGCCGFHVWVRDGQIIDAGTPVH